MSQYNCNGRTAAYCYAHLDTSPFTCITLARPKQVGFNTDTDLCGLLSPFETQQFVRRFGCTAASCNHAAGGNQTVPSITLAKTFFCLTSEVKA